MTALTGYYSVKMNYIVIKRLLYDFSYTKKSVYDIFKENTILCGILQGMTETNSDT